MHVEHNLLNCTDCTCKTAPPRKQAFFFCIPIIWNEYADWICIIHDKMDVIVMHVSQWQSPLPLHVVKTDTYMY